MIDKVLALTLAFAQIVSGGVLVKGGVLVTPNVVNPPVGGDDNTYCGSGDIPLWPLSDGPAAFANRCFNTAMSETDQAVPGTIRTVNNGSDMTAALTAAACGDRIQLTAGITLNGTGTGVQFTLPNKGCTKGHYIEIVSSGIFDPRFPAEGQKVTPCFAGLATTPDATNYPCPSPVNLMAKIVAPTNASGALIAAGSGYRVIGIELTRVCNPGVVFNLFNVQTNIVNDIIFDRSIMHGCPGTGFPTTNTTAQETKVGLAVGQGTRIASINSYYYDFWCAGNVGACVDSQAISGGFGTVTQSGWGNYKFVNNTLSAAGMSLFFGGAAGPALTPPGCSRGVNCNTDAPDGMEIRRNYMYKPLNWNGNTASAVVTSGWPLEKNCVEMKNGVHLFFEGNFCQNTWRGGQEGFVFEITPKNAPSGGVGSCPTCEVSDVVYRYNGANNPSYGIAVATAVGDSCTNCEPLWAKRISIHDVVVENINLNHPDGITSGEADAFEISSDGTPIDQVSIRHVLVTTAVRSLMILGTKIAGTASNLTFQDSIVPNGAFDVLHVGGAGTCDQPFNHQKPISDNCITNTIWDHNVIMNGTANVANWYPGNFFNPPANVGFVNFNSGNGGNYFLCRGAGNPSFLCLAASPYINAASDGSDIGPNLTTYFTKIAGVTY